MSLNQNAKLSPIKNINSGNLGQTIIDYLEYCEIQKYLSQNTIRMYHFYLNDYVTWLQASLNKTSTDISDINPELIKKYRLDLNRRISNKSQEEYKRSTQKNFLVAIRAFLKYLVVEKGIETMSPEQIILGKSEDRVPKVLNTDQMQRLFEVQDLNKRSGVRDRAILELLFSTGLRVSELVGLNTDSMNLKTGEFTVIGKGRKARTVYLSPAAINWIKRYLGTRADSFKPLFLRYSGKNMTDGDIDGNSLRLTVRSVERLVKKYTKRAGISVDATPHTLRHTFATGLLSEGADLRSVQELLGHSSVSTTQIYTHVTNFQLREVHKKFHKDIEIVPGDNETNKKEDDVRDIE
jgi:site-specific recombinase XerD